MSGQFPGGDVLSIDPLPERAGVVAVDSLERRRYALFTPSPVDPAPVDADGFPIPVDAAVSVTTESVTLRQVPDVYVRDADGEMLAEVHPPMDESLPAGEYTLELNAPIKVYLQVAAPVTVDATFDRVRVEFGGPTTVRIGARSFHRRPATTIRTTADPADLATAVSHLSAALKTTSCERSYPTLRGHPPALELGDALDVPVHLDPPETGVHLELPLDLRELFVAPPLSYYLAADVVPAETPRLVTDRGFEYDLTGERGFEAEVSRVLRQCFFLDCLVRTEGLYRVDLHERAAVEPDLPFDVADCYGRPLADRLETYLAVPYDRIADHVPTWQLVAYVEPVAANVAALPFLVDDLAVIRSPDTAESSPSAVRATVLESYLRVDGGVVRGNDPDPSAGGDADLPVGSADPPVGGLDSPAGGTDDEPVLIRPDGTDAVERVWFEDSLPVGANKGVIDAYRNDLDRTPRSDAIDITVVCNDGAMGGERDAVAEAYGSREDLPFDVTIYRDLSTAALRDVLATEADFFHYIGHIDGAGFACRDGTLDAATLESVGVAAFLLNACQSYEQGCQLLRAGAVGGVVTFEDVPDAGAVAVGRTMARLLNLGFPLQAALSIAREDCAVGGHYLVVGKGGVDVAQEENSIPVLPVVETVGDDEYAVDVVAFLPREGGMGTMVYPCLAQNEQLYLAPGHLRTFRVSRAELEEYLALQRYPIRMDGELVWNDDVEAPPL